MPVKDLFAGIEEEALVKFSPAISYQEIGYVKYSLDFWGLNTGMLEDRQNPTALKRTFKLWAMTSQSLNPTESLLVHNKNKNIATTIKTIQLFFF